MAYVDDTHQHLVTSVLTTDTRTPFVSYGGATGPTGAAGATGSTGPTGAGLVLRRVGPLRIAFDTAGLVNPANYGVEVGDSGPGGSLLLSFAIAVSEWTTTGEGTYLQLGIYLGTAAAARSMALANYEPLRPSNNGTEYLPEGAGTPATPLVGSGPLWAVTEAGDKIVVAVYTDFTAVSGAADIYAIIVTPAA